MEKKSQLEIKVDNLKELESSLKSNCRSLAEEIGELGDSRDSLVDAIESGRSTLQKLEADKKSAINSIEEERSKFEAYKTLEDERIKYTDNQLKLDREAILSQVEAFNKEVDTRKDKLEELDRIITNLSTEVESLTRNKKELELKAKLLLEVSKKVSDMDNLLEEEKRMIESQRKFQEEVLALFDKEKNEYFFQIEEVKTELSNIQKQKEGVSELERQRTKELDEREKNLIIRADRVKRYYKENLGIDINV